MPDLCACCALSQECLPTSQPTKVLPFFRASSSVLLADPSSSLPGPSPLVGLDSEVLVSVCCSLEEGCVSSCWWLVCPSRTGTCALTCTSSPVSTDRCILHSVPSKSPIPSLPTRCLGSRWPQDPGSDPRFLAYQGIQIETLASASSECLCQLPV